MDSNERPGRLNGRPPVPLGSELYKDPNDIYLPHVVQSLLQPGWKYTSKISQSNTEKYLLGQYSR